MATGYEIQMYQDISSIARSLERIANYMGTAEARASQVEPTTPEDIVRAGQAIAAVRRGFEYIEDSQRAAAEERELFGDAPDEPPER